MRPGDAANRAGLSAGKSWAHAALAHGWRFEAELEKADQARLDALCQRRVVLLAPRNWRPPAGPCLFIGPETVNTGPLAVEVFDSDVARLTTVSDRAGRRFWTADPAGANAQ